MQQALLGIENRKPKPIPVPPRLAVKGGRQVPSAPPAWLRRGSDNTPHGQVMSLGGQGFELAGEVTKELDSTGRK